MTILDRVFENPPAAGPLALFIVGLVLGTVFGYLSGQIVNPATQYPGVLAFLGLLALIGGIGTFFGALSTPSRMKPFHVFLWTLAGIAAFPVGYIPAYLLLAT